MAQAVTDDAGTPEPAAKIYFSDFFEVNPTRLEEYGAFNVSLVNDLPLFVDPFLLFDSDNSEYVTLHDEIIKYVRFLRDAAVSGTLTEGHFSHWFFFPEISQNWLGFSRTGNKGSGLGRKFANALRRNLQTMFSDFGKETISRGSHLEKLCLVAYGVGRDHLSDFATNLIQHHLLEYTQKFAAEYIRPEFVARFAIDKVTFNYQTGRWQRRHFNLPAFNGDYVLLTPKDILTKDEAWINRLELLDQFTDIYNSVPNDQLRAQINDFFVRALAADPTGEERRQAAAASVEQYPEILDYYIRWKEDRADEAHSDSKRKVEETEFQFIVQINRLVSEYLQGTRFYELGNSYDEALNRVDFLKNVIENRDGYRLFYVKGRPVQREADLQIMYALTWYATAYDVNREVNNGRGPVDFKVSNGKRDKSLVEFKLASNKKLKQNLENQVGIYETANDTKKSIKVIMHFSDTEYERVQKVLKELKLTGQQGIVLIDACATNKPSASNA